MTVTKAIRYPASAATLLAALLALLAGASVGEAERLDVRAPDTYIRSAPVSTSGIDATFVFSSTEAPGARFGCSLDWGTFRRCESPKRYGGLGAGRHVFKVRATDVAGNVDRTPASHHWTVVEDQAPVVSIEGAPRIESYYEYHYFEFSADVPGSVFYCSLDEEPFATCASGQYRYVPYGQHVFRVYAVGPDGARGETSIVEYESRDPNWD